jgi:hypothetical protein
MTPQPLRPRDRDIGPSVGLDFLGSWPFRWKGPAPACWIVLDLLGFTRPNFSMGYADFSGKNFSPFLFRGHRSAGTGPCARGHAEVQDRS